MSLLIETIRLEDGQFRNLSYHEQRMTDSVLSLFKIQNPFDLGKILDLHPHPKKGLHKCRVIYDHENIDVEIEPYTIRPVSSLKMIVNDEISYSLKYKDRTGINGLFDGRGSCDDILIIKDGEVTDSSYANIVFKKGADWVTPASCLLRGTMRHYLLDHNQIKLDLIQRKDIRKFERFKLINAMLGFESLEVDVSRIID
jgi:4-amino-4-deoxychorismate lyase